MPTIAIYPRFDPHYHTYFLSGLRELFGTRALRYTTRDFPWLPRRALAVRLGDTKVYFDARDPSDIEPRGMAWCDVYAKMNLDSAVPSAAERAKIVPTGPILSPQIWGLFNTARHALHTFIAAHGNVKDTRLHFAEYWQQYKVRVPLRQYMPQRSEPDYLFFNSTIWFGEPVLNTQRANYIQAAQNVPGVRFEGGLYPRRSDTAVPDELKPVLSTQIYPVDAYARNVARSAAVFNTPAVAGCLGFKLCEYLALGKAIISTPLGRELPAPLVHGQHVHFVDGSQDSLHTALVQICTDHAYRQHLEHGARAYFDAHVAPARMVAAILKRAGVTHAHPTPPT